MPPDFAVHAQAKALGYSPKARKEAQGFVEREWVHSWFSIDSLGRNLPPIKVLRIKSV